ncbi:unnamed protein product [Paramecium octaurelia]|uniref:MORN repeat protein n=1 Tax=Paramecium octaurelia TaxID=43137 RepID=A0A8S1VAU8_PAROT|nr:unnamed protein product [Paramecium octaurelia]
MVTIKMEKKQVDGIFGLKMKKLTKRCTNTLYSFCQNLIFKFSGGGLYDDIDEYKTGQWIEISYNFFYDQQVTLNGEYQNGKKVGRWDIWIKHDEINKKIGGGFYDDSGHGHQVGKWVEFQSKGFDEIYTSNGLYCKSKKVGLWEINSINFNVQEYQTIQVVEIYMY